MYLQKQKYPDGEIKLKYSLYYFPFMKGIHQLLMNYPSAPPPQKPSKNEIWPVGPDSI